ncbi:hypothetical protein [Flammeovirga agarivorans]|uniref:Uncharacterized protein n=1 Tax=Flammeovirga agarivorans TaxID=2726742 RepID=A0A7X8XZB4_9BACT|nr:hypothetical protein [Flammeovirga agarivorans]NLR94893.1 hypothetical protein [Flammeovirga agarivorans]
MNKIVRLYVYESDLLDSEYIRTELEEGVLLRIKESKRPSTAFAYDLVMLQYEHRRYDVCATKQEDGDRLLSFEISNHGIRSNKMKTSDILQFTKNYSHAN